MPRGSPMVATSTRRSDLRDTLKNPHVVSRAGALRLLGALLIPGEALTGRAGSGADLRSAAGRLRSSPGRDSTPERARSSRLSTRRARRLGPRRTETCLTPASIIRGDLQMLRGARRGVPSRWDRYVNERPILDQANHESERQNTHRRSVEQRPKPVPERSKWHAYAPR